MVEIMSPKIVTVEEAEARLLELIGLAEQGEEVVIAYEDQPKVKLVPYSTSPTKTGIWPTPGENLDAPGL